MDSVTELLGDIRSQGWEVSWTAHGYTCQGCLYAALNGASLAKYDQATSTGYTGPGNHCARVTRKDT